MEIGGRRPKSSDRIAIERPPLPSLFGFKKPIFRKCLAKQVLGNLLCPLHLLRLEQEWWIEGF
jgi:hypothetical protein